jgi:hypothetical protein
MMTTVGPTAGTARRETVMPLWLILVVVGVVLAVVGFAGVGQWLIWLGVLVLVVGLVLTLLGRRGGARA